VKAKGEELAEPGVTVPAPSEVIVTEVAFVNVFPLTVTGVMPQMLPVRLLSISAGPFAQPQETAKELPIVVHPAAFLTVIVWFPLAMPVNVTPL